MGNLEKWYNFHFEVISYDPLILIKTRGDANNTAAKVITTIVDIGEDFIINNMSLIISV